MRPYYEHGGVTIFHGDCLDVLPMVPDASVNLIATDPPYFRVKGLDWDRQWDSPAAFLTWLDRVLAEFARVLKPNGSLYLFASPKMAARVECLIAQRFAVLNSVVWNKLQNYDPGDQRATAYRARDVGSLRRFFDYSERIIFATSRTDGTNPVGDAIRRARLNAGLRPTDIDVALGYVRRKDPTKGTELCRRWEEGSSLPSAVDFARAMQACGVSGDYQALLADFETKRRPFEAVAQFTDVWNYATVPAHPGKHPCEKPLDLCEHIVRTSSRPGDLVLDAFCGSGVMGRAALTLGRRFIGCEKDEVWTRRAVARIQGHLSQEVLAL